MIEIETLWNAVNFEPTVKIGDIITLAGFLIGGLGFVWAMKWELKMLANVVHMQGEEIKGMKEVVSSMALAHQRMDFLDKQVEELRHGIGFKIHREFPSGLTDR